ncbi:RING finger protein 151 isoform X2 [Takifugu flavidus]|uniref:E3 ubiquitin-protein ligase NRDP1 n=1 Tax=Takifugu flavidus TaxID=433684 RepID=A0A5C6PLR4_9TELE|nr:RING finger protein 151 isoform X2 [Takifugu flavidus]TWW79240.1 hypothetical protein D4764_10G0002700 [Takifugu flavidus]
MGYDLERFVGYVNEGLLCCVCRDVLERPLQAPCEHAFCSSCISSWLVYHRSCPEDRLPLDVSSLKPLYRYMRNDLTRLQIRCVNAAQGCEVVCSLENLHAHEDECEFAFVSCSNTGCPVQVERRGLEAHLSECNFRRECPKGCGHMLPSPNQSQHNCVAELRIEVEMLRAEMMCKVEEVRREMESRLDSQRRHMVQKESQLKSEVEELKGQLACLMSDMRALLGAERLRRQELAEAEVEKRELLELLKDMQPSRGRPPVGKADRERNQGEQQTSPWEVYSESRQQQQRETTFPSMCAFGSPASPQLGDAVRKGGTRSVTLDCIKRKSREVTVI